MLEQAPLANFRLHQKIGQTYFILDPDDGLRKKEDMMKQFPNSAHDLLEEKVIEALAEHMLVKRDFYECGRFWALYAQYFDLAQRDVLSGLRGLRLSDELRKTHAVRSLTSHVCAALTKIITGHYADSYGTVRDESDLVISYAVEGGLLSIWAN